MMIYPTLHPKAAKMKNLYLLNWLIVLVISGCDGIGHGPGEKNAAAAKGRIDSMSKEIIPKLAGTWKLISFHSKDSSGQTTYPFGKDAQGRLIYEPDGRMAAQLMNPNRPRFASDDPLVTSEAEVRAAFGGYTAYSGPIRSIRTNRPSCTTSRSRSSPTGWGRISCAISNSTASI